MIATKNKSLLNQAINTDYVFISVMGTRVQLNEDELLRRKTDDIKRHGESFWVSDINEKYIKECREEYKGMPGYVILVKSKSKVNNKNLKTATHYSEDNINWKDINANISPVMGKLPSEAYSFDNIEIINTKNIIDLDCYEDTINSGAIKFGSGNTYSNVFAKKSAVKLPGGMKDHKREIVAVLRLKAPYVVWVK